MSVFVFVYVCACMRLCVRACAFTHVCVDLSVISVCMFVRMASKLA